MSPFVLFLIFGGYTAAYWGANLARHKSAVPFMYATFKIGPSTYPQLGSTS